MVTVKVISFVALVKCQSTCCMSLVCCVTVISTDLKFLKKF